jgi:hypothetical protein
MEVPAAGMGASGPDRAAANPVSPAPDLPSAARSAPIPGDSIAALLSELSPADLQSLLKVIESSSRGLDDAHSADLLRGAAEALAHRDPDRALDVVRHFAGLDPDRAEGLASAPALASIRPEVERVLAQLTATARLHAESSLADATKRFETGSLNAVLTAQVRPEVFLAAANRLLDAGGLANYVRAAGVAAALSDPGRWVPEAAPILPPSRPPGFETRSMIWVWIAAGVAGVALCWWLRDDYLPVVCGVWAGILILLLLRRPRLR